MVYTIPHSCGAKYIGQMQRCVNDRLQEHNASLKGASSGHLAVHVRDCGCTPILEETKILAHYVERRSREVLEVWEIARSEKNCISVPCISLRKKERVLLESAA